METRIIELHYGDEIFCYPDTLDVQPRLGDYIKLNKGFEVAMSPISDDTHAIVIKIIKSNPDKRWWQFWVKQEILGYILRVVKENV